MNEIKYKIYRAEVFQMLAVQLKEKRLFWIDSTPRGYKYSIFGGRLNREAENTHGTTYVFCGKET